LTRELLDALTTDPRSIPSKLLYDARGSQLFEQVCKTEEYYVTRVELEIMREHAAEMAEHCGPRCALIEYGSGSGIKTRILLEALSGPAAYVPIDISRHALEDSVDSLSQQFPELTIHPICGDYTLELDLPDLDAQRSVVYFPGSTIGNFEPDDARAFLGRAAAACGPGGAMLIGVDLHKSSHLLEQAYDDGAGVTAEFELNVLHRLNREFDADFDVAGFEYEALYNEDERRVEMYVTSQRDQKVEIADLSLELQNGERIRTEHAYKYSLEDFAALAQQASFEVEKLWLDQDELFSVQMLRAA
jgi:dimethylhistidine N-methyltransferase